MPRYCPSCSFDLSSIMVKNNTEEQELPKKVIKQLDEEGVEETPVKIVRVRQASKKQAEHLKKAREKASEAITKKNQKLKEYEEKEKQQQDTGFKQMFLF